MACRRALVDCVVLSLQDACVFYPCCKGCFSRIDIEQKDTTRCRCFKCGYNCLKEQVDYRYRLSLRVTRDGCIFGVTIFGTCLNQFFGIHASGLQRLVENLDGPVGASTRSTLLLKAVEDCFIGRRFIFGIKLTETETLPWLGGPKVNFSSRKDTVHFIASQMILPNAAGLVGCTVVSYYQILLQKAAEYELETSDPSKNCRPPAATLLLIPHHSPASSFNNVTLCASGLLPKSLQRSKSQDCTLTPTPPWQQSLGLITSSAEQEEGSGTQDSGDEDSRQRTDNNKTPHHAQRGCWEDHKATDQSVLSPAFYLDNSSYIRMSFAEYLNSYNDQATENTPVLNTFFSPTRPGHNSSKVKRFSARQHTNTFLPSSFAWEDLPFSESLSEFLCEENKDLDIVVKTEPHVNVQNQEETTKNKQEMRSQEQTSLIKSTPVCQSDTQITESHSRILLDISNAPAKNGSDRHDLPDGVRKNPAGSFNKSQARNSCSHEFSERDEKASLLYFEDVEEEQLEGDTYDCSADLFSSLLTMDMSTNTHSTHAETIRTTTEAHPVLFKPEKKHLRSEKFHVPHSTPEIQKLKSNKCFKEDSLILPGTQDFDFIPPSQSTPIVKAAVISGSLASLHRTSTLREASSQPDSQDSFAFYRNLHESDIRKPAKIPCSLCKLNCVSANHLCQCGGESTKQNLALSTTSSRQSERFTPKRRFLKPDRQVRRRALNPGPTGRITHKQDSSDCDPTLNDFKDSEAIIVPPTPAFKTCQSVKSSRRKQTENSSSYLGFICEGKQDDGINDNRTLLEQRVLLSLLSNSPTLISSQKSLARIGNCDSKTVNKRSLDKSNCYLLDDDSEERDWSRDLFSDSI